MRLILTLTVFFCLSSTKSLANIALNFQNVDLDYKHGSGNISAPNFLIKYDFFEIGGSDYLMDMSKVKEDIKFHNHDTNFQINKYAEKITMLKDLEQLQITNAVLIFERTLNLNSDAIFASFGNNQISAKSVKYDCGTVFTTPLENCLKKSSFQAGRIDFSSSGEKILAEELFVLEESKAAKGFIPKIKSVSAEIKDSNLNASVIIKILFNIRVNIYGKVEVDDKNMKLHIKNFTVKKGIFPITSIVLRILHKMNIESLEIKGNNLTITL